jgi:hypothetical protein
LRYKGDLVKEIVPVNIEEELKQSYLDYAMSVIVGRALPDVRDGLKPVHRRVLFAMSELSNDWNKPYKKSARVVGDVIGKYHPHGDSAVYDTIVRMAQHFSLRYMLVDGQGHFGSIEGDSAAAMRYTEIRMTKIAHALLQDLEKDTVDFAPNYDESESIPVVMPTRVPNLLVNGSSGIAVGMATNIPPHNLSEVIDGCLALIDNSDITIDELMEHIPGPDFPTGAMINGRAGIVQAYRTGRGRIYVRACADIEVNEKTRRETIIITEIPYQLNKSRLIERIAELVKEKKIEGISELRDESDKDGLRVVIEIKRGEIGEVVLNNLRADAATERFWYQRGGLGRWSAKDFKFKAVARVLCSPSPRGGDATYYLSFAQGSGARSYLRGIRHCAGQYRRGNRADQASCDASRRARGDSCSRLDAGGGAADVGARRQLGDAAGWTRVAVRIGRRRVLFVVQSGTRYSRITAPSLDRDGAGQNY